ncbi:hypothetical protein BB559_001636 [Furculomyces boomerangus]|uniref:FH2 domain-containing protein n=1 Tax=Furculomyces boomerangus TaxID=61424 RepID=A0A2T9Z160_9FUNG|nr:hypothetical protein BB559_001636 [Furculomyces boomerangus]
MSSSSRGSRKNSDYSPNRSHSHGKETNKAFQDDRFSPTTIPSNPQSNTFRNVVSATFSARSSSSTNRTFSSGTPRSNSITTWADEPEGDNPRYKIDYSNPDEVDEEFEQMMHDMDLKEEQKDQMRNMTIEKKITLLHSKSQYREFRGDKSKPGAFCRVLKDAEVNTIEHKKLIHLKVCLTTQPIAWVREFVNREGLKWLTILLKKITSGRHRFNLYCTRVELEILRCMKVILNIEWGAQEAIQVPDCITALCFSLDSQVLMTRKIAAELLTFVCYCGNQVGHFQVIKGIEELQQIRGENTFFGAWLQAFEDLLNLDPKQISPSRLGLVAPQDKELIDIGIANMILVNSIVSVCEDAETRTEYRAQLSEAGIERIMKKLSKFENPLISLQIDKYMTELEQDYNNLLESYNMDGIEDDSDINILLNIIKENLVSDPKTSEYFTAVIQRLLLLKDPSYGSQQPQFLDSMKPEDDNSLFIKRLQLVDSLIEKVIVENKKPEMLEIPNNSRINVGSIINSFSNEDSLEEIIRESIDLKEQLEKVTREKTHLEQEVANKSEGLVGNLKNKIFALEDLLRMSRHTIEGLQTQNKELRKQFAERLHKQENHLKQILQTVESVANDADAVSVQRNQFQLENVALRTGTAWDYAEKDGKIVPILNQTRLEKEVEKLKHLPSINTSSSLTKSKIEQVLMDGKDRSNSDTALKPSPLSLTQSPDQTKETGSFNEISRNSSRKRTISNKRYTMGIFPKDVAESLSSDHPLPSRYEQNQTYSKQGDINIKTNSFGMIQGPKSSGDDSIEKENDDVTSASQLGLSSKNLIGSDQEIMTQVRSTSDNKQDKPLPEIETDLNNQKDHNINAHPKPMPISGNSSMESMINQRATNLEAEGQLISDIFGSSSNSLNKLGKSSPESIIMSNSMIFGPVPRKELRFIPRKKLKMLQWDKMSDHDQLNQTFWIKYDKYSKKSEDEIELTLHKNGTFERLENMFSAKEGVDLNLLRERKRLERERNGKKEDSRDTKASDIFHVPSILSSKRSNNINIMLGRLKKFKLNELKDAVMTLNDTILTENILKQFLAYLPTPEEKALITVQHQTNGGKLARADQFLFEMMSVFRYEKRLSVMLTRISWKEHYDGLMEDIGAVSVASKAVSSSSNLSTILGVVLTIGNFMNGAGFRGGAFGFKISSLTKLMDTKALDNKTTLLHFLASTLEEHFPETLEVLVELKPVDSACRVSYQEMRTELNEMTERLEEAKIELQLHIDREDAKRTLLEVDGPDDSTLGLNREKIRDDGGSRSDLNVEKETKLEQGGNNDNESNNNDDRFISFISAFIQKASTQLKIVTNQISEMDVLYSYCIRLYGEDPNTMAPDEFFGIFRTFIFSLEKTIKDNKMEKNRKLATEKRRQQIEASLEVRKRNAAMNTQKTRGKLGSPENDTKGASSGVPSGESTSLEGVQGSNEKGTMDDLINSLRQGNALGRSSVGGNGLGGGPGQQTGVANAATQILEHRRPRRREINSIRQSTLRRSLHRTSISLKAMQMLKEIDEDSHQADKGMAPPVPKIPTALRKSNRAGMSGSISSIDVGLEISSDEVMSDSDGGVGSVGGPSGVGRMDLSRASSIDSDEMF